MDRTARSAGVPAGLELLRRNLARAAAAVLAETYQRVTQGLFRQAPAHQTMRRERRFATRGLRCVEPLRAQLGLNQCNGRGPEMLGAMRNVLDPFKIQTGVLRGREIFRDGADARMPVSINGSSYSGRSRKQSITN